MFRFSGKIAGKDTGLVYLGYMDRDNQNIKGGIHDGCQKLDCLIGSRLPRHQSN